MRCPRPLLAAVLTLAVALPADAAGTAPADPECTAPKGQRWQTGKLVKLRVEERAEGGPSSVTPPQVEGAPPAPEAEPYGQILDLALTSRGRTWVARCVVGSSGCSPAALEGTTSVRFLIAGKTLVLKRQDGRLLCARVAAR